MKKKLVEYSQSVYPFHMPGHKGGRIKVVEDLYNLDVTEVDGTDDLMHPEGIIKDALESIKEIYKSGSSYMLVNSSTGGILSAITAVFKLINSPFLIGRNCHKSVYNALNLNKIDVDYIYPAYVPGTGFYGAIDIHQVEEKLKKGYKCMVLTSPTYEGIVSDIKAIARLVHDYNGYLIVDEAHGAHYTFCNQLPISALELGADIVIHSVHKTLPCFTQTGLLHLSKTAATNKHLVDLLEDALSTFQSSSPSYVFMNSIYEGVRYMDQHRDVFTSYVKWMKNHILEIQTNKKYGYWYCKDNFFDQTRLVYVINDHHTTGFELSQHLRDGYNIQVELSGLKHIVAISTLADQREAVERLFTCVEKSMEEIAYEKYKINNDEIERLIPVFERNDSHEIMSMLPELLKSVSNTEKVCESYEINPLMTEMVSLDYAVDQVAGVNIIPYPPGIPLVVKGEKISREVIAILKVMIDYDLEVYGIIKEKVKIVRGSS